MKYIIIILGVLPSIYTISYGAYCYRKKNKIAAAGAMLVTLVSAALWAGVVLFRW